MDPKVFMRQLTERVKFLITEPDVHIYGDIFLKNNDTKRYGIVVEFPDDSMVCPTIYIDHFYDDFLKKKQTMDDLAQQVWQLIRQIRKNQHHYQNFSMDWNQCREKIFYRLISKNLNKNQLKNMPYLPFLDMAIIFGVLLSHDSDCCETVTIQQSLADHWQVDTSELFEIAEKNTCKLFPAMKKPLLEFISDYMGKTCHAQKQRKNQERILPEDNSLSIDITDNPPMHIVTNQYGLYGASTILYPGYIEQLAKEFESDLYILPSSIHEVIILPSDTLTEDCDLSAMVQQVNQTHVKQEEILSANAYYYDAAMKKFSILS